MSFVNTSCPYSQEWKSTSERRWTCEGTGDTPLDLGSGPINWDDWNAQIGLMSDLINNRNQRGQNHIVPFKCSENKFEIRLDLSNFEPQEFNVKIVDKDLVIECKHDEKKDQFGFVSRQFTRKFKLPEDVDVEKMKATLSSARILTIEVPKKFFQTKEENVVYIPIIHEKEPTVNEQKVDSEGQTNGQSNGQQISEEEKSEKSEVNIEVKQNWSQYLFRDQLIALKSRFYSLFDCLSVKTNLQLS